MLYDLNIAWSPSTKTADLEKTLRFSSSLGYDVVAINHTIGAPIPNQIVNSIPQLTPPHKSHPQPPSSKTPAAPSDLPTTLRRVTVLIADPATNHRLPALAAAYDILAVRPTTEKAFQAACTSITEASLISLDLSSFFPFHFRPKPVMAAVNRGVRFEICYAQALASSSSSSSSDAPADARARANFIANTISLVRATRGRGLVVSSEARAPLGLRAPADVINLLAVWGLATERGTEALSVNPRAVVVNEGIKRRGFRGVIDIVETPGKDESNGSSRSKTDEGSSMTKQKHKAPVIGSKRKDKADGGDDTSKSPQQAMSKRQAKKMKIASMNAANPS